MSPHVFSALVALPRAAAWLLLFACRFGEVVGKACFGCRGVGGVQCMLQLDEFLADAYGEVFGGEGSPFGGGSPFEFFFGTPRQNEEPEEREFRQEGMGSGVIVARQGSTVMVSPSL